MNSAFGKKINSGNYFKFMAGQVPQEGVFETEIRWQEVYWGFALWINI